MSQEDNWKEAIAHVDAVAKRLEEEQQSALEREAAYWREFFNEDRVEELEQQVQKLIAAMDDAHSAIKDIYALAKRGLVYDSEREGHICDLARTAGKALLVRYSVEEDNE